MKTLTLLLFSTFFQGIALAQEADSVYTVVEKSAAPVGGMTVLFRKIGDMMPMPAKNDCNVWKVFIEFIVEKDGTLTNVRLLRDESKACNEIWIEPFKKISKEVLWEPGKINGLPVRQRFVLPIAIKPG